MIILITCNIGVYYEKIALTSSLNNSKAFDFGGATE